MVDRIKRYREEGVEITGVATGIVFPIDQETELIDSTITPLGAAGVYNSGNLAVKDYEGISGTVFADQNGTFYLEFSPDGTNFDYTQMSTYFANQEIGFQIKVKTPTFRIRFVNGAGIQTIFRLYVFGKK